LSFIKRRHGTVFRNTENVSSNGKQHNRGQDGAGFASVKLDVGGERYIK
jgi:amidophosphoribosyltransferase